MSRTRIWRALQSTAFAAFIGGAGGYMLAWLVKERGITPHIPVFDKSKREDSTLSRADFTWDGERGL